MEQEPVDSMAFEELVRAAADETVNAVSVVPWVQRRRCRGSIQKVSGTF